ncbi:halocin C8 precursor-like protein [Staphylococcus capitis]|uniref:halocin C8 precursor-like protein n=1 Tax=Staphylococcus capitis TaxID=29388 RepID=UPI001EFD8E11|nr:halocin C8 precursor-like protein [Staphylococcus capitis]
MKKVLGLIILFVTVVSLTFNGNLSKPAKAEEKNQVTKPQSNVSETIKHKMITKIKASKQYKNYASDTSINQINKENIIVTKTKSKENKNSVYTVSFIFGEKLAKKNKHLSMVEFKYNTGNKKVFYDHAMYTKFIHHNGKKFINVSGSVSGNKYYEFNLGQDSKLYDKNFKLTTQKNIENQSYKNLPPRNRGWCEWAVGALCGTGGGAACYAAAAGLGITTGVGGFALATVCSLIGSLGCTAATNKICG